MIGKADGLRNRFHTHWEEPQHHEIGSSLQAKTSFVESKRSASEVVRTFDSVECGIESYHPMLGTCIVDATLRDSRKPTGLNARDMRDFLAAYQYGPKKERHNVANPAAWARLETDQNRSIYLTHDVDRKARKVRIRAFDPATAPHLPLNKQFYEDGTLLSQPDPVDRRDVCSVRFFLSIMIGIINRETLHGIEPRLPNGNLVRPIVVSYQEKLLGDDEVTTKPPDKSNLHAILPELRNRIPVPRPTPT